MDGIRFNDEVEPQVVIREMNGITQWVVRTGLVQNDVDARRFLLVSSIVALILAAIVFLWGSSAGSRTPETTFTVSPSESVGSQQGLPQ